jgi:serine/threonine protein kinase
MTMSEPNPSPPGSAAGPAPGGYEPAPTRIGQMPPPLLMNRYQVIRLLGRGASGEVLEVRDLSTDIFYAFKRVAPEITQQSTQLQTLQSNFALVSQLAHPHIATTRFFERDPQNGDVFFGRHSRAGFDLWRFSPHNFSLDVMTIDNVNWAEARMVDEMLALTRKYGIRNFYLTVRFCVTETGE